MIISIVIFYLVSIIKLFLYQPISYLISQILLPIAVGAEEMSE